MYIYLFVTIRHQSNNKETSNYGSRPEVFCKKLLWKVSQNSSEARASLLKRPRHTYVFCEFCEIFQNSFFIEHLLLEKYSERFMIYFEKFVVSPDTLTLTFPQLTESVWNGFHCNFTATTKFFIKDFFSKYTKTHFQFFD